MVKTVFDDFARGWDKRNQWFASDITKIVQCVDYLKICTGDRVLDLGAGTGRLSSFIRNEMNKECVFCALDNSENMLREGKKIIEENDIYQILGDGHYLPFSDNQFDHILLFSCFPHFNKKYLLLKECRRTLKKSSNLLIFHVSGRKELNAFHAASHHELKNDILPEMSLFQQWGKELGFSLKRGIDNEDLFLIHFMKQ